MTITAEDRFQIEQQIYRYAHAYDTGDIDAFVSVFTEDGVGEAVFVGASEVVSRTVGHDEIRAFAEAGRDRNLMAGPGVHYTSSILFEDLSVDAPRTRSVVLVTKQIDGEPVIVTHGSYVDDWRKTDEGWRIVHRLYITNGYRSAGQPVQSDEERASVRG